MTDISEQDKMIEISLQFPEWVALAILFMMAVHIVLMAVNLYLKHKIYRLTTKTTPTPDNAPSDQS